MHFSFHFFKNNRAYTLEQASGLFHLESTVNYIRKVMRNKYVRGTHHS